MSSHLEDRLTKNFNNVNDWLKFAESKNAMLIAFNVASIYGIFQSIELEIIKNENVLKPIFLVAVIILILSTINSLISFTPILKLFRINPNLKSINSNIIFFEYLKTKTSEEILSEMNDFQTKIFTQYEKNLSEQIKYNSHIASLKYRYFKISLYITIFVYIIMLFAIPYLLFI